MLNLCHWGSSRERIQKLSTGMQVFVISKCHRKTQRMCSSEEVHALHENVQLVNESIKNTHVSTSPSAYRGESKMEHSQGITVIPGQHFFEKHQKWEQVTE